MAEVLAGLTSPPPQTDSGNMVMTGIPPPLLTILSPSTECFSPTFRTGSPEDARRHVDQEIERLEDSIRTLKSRRNTFAPISKLPPELLAKTFVMCAQMCFGNIDTLRRIREWVQVTQVSRHWRAVALNCPNLWAYPIFNSPRFCEEMLRRSKMAPIVIFADLDLPTRRMVESIQLAFKEMYRVKELTIMAPAETIQKLFAEPLTSAPILHKLSFSGSRRRFGMYGNQVPYTIPEDFLSSGGSSLFQLELQDCDVTWSSPFLSGLTHMKIHRTSEEGKPTTVQLLDVLENMPQLEVLDLALMLPTDSPESLGRVVNLPHLTELRLDGSVPECGNLLKYVAFPGSVNISLQCRGTESTGIDFSSILSIFSRPLDGIETGRPLLGAVFDVNPKSLKFSGYESEFPNVHTFNSMARQKAAVEQPAVELRLSWESNQRLAAQEVMLSLCREAPLWDITTAFVNGSRETFETEAWIAMLGHISSLTELGVASTSVHNLLSALVVERSGGTEDGSSSESSLIHFPNLRELAFHGVDFDEEKDDSDEEWSHLLNVMAERSAREAAITKLSLTECRRVYSEELVPIRGEVEDVQWDELQLGFSSEDESDNSEDEDEDEYGGCHYSPTMSGLLYDDDWM